MLEGINICHPSQINKEFHLNVSEFLFTLLFELLWFIEKKLEAFDVIDSWCCILMRN
jgi:hypothetical protein